MSVHNKVLTVLAIVCLLSMIGTALGSIRALGIAAASLIAIGRLGLDQGATS